MMSNMCKYQKKRIIIKCDLAVYYVKYTETGEDTHAHSSIGCIKPNKQRRGPSCTNKPSLSGELEDGDLCTDGRKRDG